MLKRQHKTDLPPQGPPRILVVDDNPDAARLLGKICRRAGYEVAEVGDHQVALVTLVNEPAPISAVIASFSATGTTAALKLLDAIRHTPEPKVHTQKVVLLIDTAKQQLFSWQSGADEVMLRPFFAEELLDGLAAAIDRPDAERGSYRRQRIEQIRESMPDYDELSTAIASSH